MPLLPEDISYTIKRHNITKLKTVIKIDRNEGVIVEAPYLLPESVIQKFVYQHIDWIRKRLHVVQRAKSFKHEYVDGETFSFFGDIYTLKLLETEEVSSPRIKVVNKTFFGALPPKTLDKKRIAGLREQLYKWYIQKSPAVFHKKATQYAQQINMTFDRLAVKDMTSRWGSCSHDQNLSFNWKLALAPPEVCDYVVAHEIAHLKHKHHQKSFWDCVSQLDIEYRIHRNWLKKNGDTLTL